MFSTYVVVTLLTVTANSYAATVDFLHTDRTVANAVTVGASRSWLIPLGTLKAAGALGLLVGIGIPPLGIAAAIGLILFFTAAVIAHLRVGWYSTIAFPATFLLLAATTLALRLATT